MLGPNNVIAKKSSCTYCYQVRCTTLIVRVGGMPWPQTCTTHYYEMLGLPNKVLTMKELVVCYVVRIYEDYGFLDMRKVYGSGRLLWSGLLSSTSTTKAPQKHNILVHHFCFPQYIQFIQGRLTTTQSKTVKKQVQQLYIQNNADDQLISCTTHAMIVAHLASDIKVLGTIFNAFSNDVVQAKNRTYHLPNAKQMCYNLCYSSGFSVN